MKKHGLDQSQISAKIMRNEELPYDIAKEVFYLDANNRIINIINHRSKDPSDWEVKDYLSSLFETAIDWAALQPELLRNLRNTGALSQIHPIDDNVLIPNLVISSFKRYDKSQNNPPDSPEAA